MDQGQIVESSTAKQIFDHPQMSRTQQFLARYRGDYRLYYLKSHGLSMTFMHL
mgnify:CR=1 FL=1